MYGTPNNQDLLNVLGGGSNFSFNPGVNNISTPTNMSANLGFTGAQPNLGANPVMPQQQMAQQPMQQPTVHPAMLPSLYTGAGAPSMPTFKLPTSTPYLGNSGPSFMAGMFGRPNG